MLTKSEINRREIRLLLVICLLIFTLTGCKSNVNGAKATEVPHKTASEQGETITDTTTAKPNGSKKKIVFSTFYEEGFLKDAIKKYEVKHPNIEIQLTFAHPNGNDINWDADYEKFVKTTNTQMLTG
jgi:ABC-type glycerol-3-phosphate transport system substrate-binding protein